jgi:hypothetical protein
MGETEEGREMKVFFSWQLDRPAIAGRNFIERALEDAVKAITTDVSVEAAVREALKVDRDTKDVPGSPAVFDTILRKIEAAAAFIPDFTFIAIRPNGEPTKSECTDRIRLGASMSRQPQNRRRDERRLWRS